MINYLFETASKIGDSFHADIIFILCGIAITVLFVTVVLGSIKLKK